MLTTDLPFAVLLLFTAVFGLSLGSFINVIIWRLPIILERRWLKDSYATISEAGEKASTAVTAEPLSLALPPSHCPLCKEKLKAHHKIPLLSYFLLRGRCEFCGGAIDKQYPLVESLAALVSVAIVAQAGISLQSLTALVFSWTLIALAFIDINKRLLPDELTLGLLWLGLAVNSFDLFVPADEAIPGAIAGYAALWLIYQGMRLLTGREGMGYGDMKLLAAIGAWCGWQALPFVVSAASITGLAVSSVLLAGQKMKKDDPIPFGPYLAIAAWLFFVYAFICECSLPAIF